MSDCPALDALDALDGPSPADDVVAAHIATCRACSVVAELLRERRRAEHARDMRVECAKFEILIAARESTGLGPAAAFLLDMHLRTCAACTSIAMTSPPLARSPTSAVPATAAVKTSTFARGREIARGGMGRILVAEDVRIGRRVAVKEVLDRSPATTRRFEREAKVTARLQHPGIVPIYEIGHWDDGTPYYVMRLVEGTTLAETLKSRKTLDERLALLPAMIAATEAVAFAHANDVIHRDLTPRNILIGAHGDTVVIDWGLAKDLADRGEDHVEVSPYRDKQLAPDLTHAGTVMGTAAYMPPEQAEGRRVDKRGDVYALGALLYQLVAATPPYGRGDSAGVIEAVRREAPTPLESLEPRVPRDLASIVRRAMARDPEERFADASELADELRRYQAGLVVESHYYSRAERARRWIARHRAIVLASVSALVVLAVVGSVALSRVLTERTRAERGERDAIAQRQAAEATSNALLVEQGRQELLRGEKLRALAYLDEAYRRGSDSPMLRVLLASAARELDAFERRLPCNTPIHAVAADPSETHVAATCGDVSRVWRVADGGLVATLPGAAEGIAFVAEGRRVLTWGEGGTRLWDSRSGAPVAAFDGPAASADAARDGSVIVVGGVDGKARVWDATTGRLRHTLDVASDSARVLVRLVPDLDAVVAGAPGHGTGGVWDVTSGKQRGPFDPPGRVVGADLHGDRAVTCGTELRVWNMRTRETVATLVGHSDYVLVCTFSEDGSRLLTGSADGTARLWDVASGRPLRVFEHGSLVATAMFGSATSDVIVTGGAWDGSIKVWSSAGALLAAYHDPQTTARRHVTMASNRLIADTAAGDLEVWRVTTPIRSRFSAPSDQKAVAVDDNGTRVITGTNDGSDARLWDVSGGRSLDLSPVAELAHAGGRVVAVTTAGDVRVIDVKQLVELRRFTPSAAPRQLRSSDDGRRLLMTVGETPEIWDVENGQRLWRIEGRFADAIDSRGRLVAIGNDAQRIEIWDVDTKQRRAQLALERPVGGEMKFALDGSRLVLVDQDMITVWNTSTGARVFAAPARDFVLSGGGAYVTARAPDGTVRTWSTLDGALIGSYFSPAFEVRVPSPDGQLLAVVAQGGGELQVRATTDGRQLASWPLTHRDYYFENGSMQMSIDFPVWTPDGASILMRGPTFVRWDVSREARSPAVLHEAIRQHLVWHVKDGQLVQVLRMLRGRVMRNGRPVADATVFVDRDTAGQLQAVGRTDATGAFSVAIPKPRSYQVTAQLEGVAFAQPRPIDCTQTETVVDIELDLAGAISGRVIGDDGAPRAGVQVTAMSDGDEGHDVTAADGTFTLGALAGRRAYTLAVVDATTGIELPAARPFPTPHVADGKDTVRGIELVIDTRAAAASVIDVARPHYIINVARDEALGVTPDGRLRLVPRSEAPRWKIAARLGGVRLTLVDVGEHMALDGDRLARTGLYSGQAWHLRREPDGSFRLSTRFQTDANSLDARTSPVTMAPSADDPAQRWRIVVAD